MGKTFVVAAALGFISATPARAQEIGARTAENPVGLLFDVDFSAASREGSRDCGTLAASARQVGATLTCDATSRMPAWGFSATVTFFRYAGVQIGYLEVGQMRLRADAAAQVVADSFVLGSTFAEDRLFGAAHGVTVLGVVRVPLKRVVPFAEAGAWRWSAASSSHSQIANTVDAALTLADEHETRASERGWDPVFGGGVEFWVTRYFAIDAGIRAVAVGGTSQRADHRFTAVSFGVTVGRS
jgi:hypothetical protein